MITESEYFAFEVDDIDARQAKGTVIPAAMRKAAYKLAANADSFISALYAGVAAGNVIDTTSVIDGDKAYRGGPRRP